MGPRWRSLLATTALGVASVVLVLLVFEAGLRLFWKGYSARGREARGQQMVSCR